MNPPEPKHRLPQICGQKAKRRARFARYLTPILCFAATLGCARTFDLTPVHSAKITPPERRGSVTGFKSDARLKEATRILVLMPDGDGAGVRDDRTPYNSGVAFLEAALVAQGRVPIVAARAAPTFTGTFPAACGDKPCQPEGDDLEYLIQIGKDSHADLILQLASSLDSEPVLARYVDARTGEVLLVGAFFAKPGHANVVMPPSAETFNNACYKAGGRPDIETDPKTSVVNGQCQFGPSQSSVWGAILAGTGGGVTLIGVGTDNTSLLVTGLLTGGVGALLLVLGNASIKDDESRAAVSRQLPQLSGTTPIAASRERTVAEALVAPLQGGAQ